MIDKLRLDTVIDLINQNKSSQEIYDYVKKTAALHEKFKGGLAVEKINFKAGVLHWRDVGNVQQKEFPELSSFGPSISVSEVVLAAFAKKIPILRTETGFLIPIPDDELAIPHLQAKSAVRHAVLDVLQKGSFFDKAAPQHE
ncbi:MAG: hypothetical protein ACK5TR_05030 [Alphaproteobacteria bacterium]|jgi:hypothetical protein